MSYLSIPMEIQNIGKLKGNPLARTQVKLRMNHWTPPRLVRTGGPPRSFVFLASLCFCFYLPEDPNQTRKAHQKLRTKKA
jgi:hypothetical protein